MGRIDQKDEDAILSARHTSNLATEALLATYRTETMPKVPENITGLDMTEVNQLDYPLFEKFFALTQEISSLTQAAIYNHLTTDPQDWGSERAGIIDQLRKKGLNSPSFRIFSKVQLEEITKEIDLDPEEWNAYAAENHTWFCIFNLPKPLNRFWRKGSSKKIGGSPMGPRIIDWGKIYEDEVMPQILGRIEEAQLATGLTLSRLNRPKHHTDEYYYVWGLSLKDRENSPGVP